jgi:hypothetical protein
MNKRIEAFKVRHFNIPQVFSYGRKIGQRLPESALFEEIAIQSDDFMARSGEPWRHDRPNVSLVTGNQNAHYFTKSALLWLLPAE